MPSSRHHWPHFGDLACDAAGFMSENSLRCASGAAMMTMPLMRRSCAFLKPIQRDAIYCYYTRFASQATADAISIVSCRAKI